MQWVALGTLPDLARRPRRSPTPPRLFLGGWGGTLLTFGAAVSILGTVGTTTLAGPRYLYALARDGFGPRFLAAVHPRFRTPANAILLQGAIALPLALSGSFVQLAALSVIARLATYLGTAAAVPVLRRRDDLPRAGFRIPGGPTIPVARLPGRARARRQRQRPQPDRGRDRARGRPRALRAAPARRRAPGLSDAASRPAAVRTHRN